MIQRIQSFLLVLAAVCVVLLFMFPVATYQVSDPVSGLEASARLDLFSKANPDMLQQIESDSNNIMMEQSGHIHTWPLVVLAFLSGAIILVDIFLYKNRPLQMKVLIGAFLLDLVYVGLVFLWAVDHMAKEFQFFAVQLSQNSEVTVSTTYSVGTWSAIVAIVFLNFALRGIKKDEDKVRAADRLR